MSKSKTNYIKPFIESLSKLNTDANNVYHVSNTNMLKLKTISNSIDGIQEEFDMKGFITEKNYDKLKRIFSSVKVIEENNSKVN